ncbi:MAG: phosphoenolpyruvate synthase [Spirochaetes bacterium]|nr:phosphoenolpyruvate synthase [Spirochaetota bacterium]
MKCIINVSSGMEGLDKILNTLWLGDNVVWQVDTVEDYKHFVIPFINQAIKDNRKLIYFRFADHEALIEGNNYAKIYNLNAYTGFESFSKKIYTIITEEGEEAFYVFDCLSSLLSAWATDLMIGNFFVITCPYLYKLNTIAYFAIFRNCHDHKTIARIRRTTQVMIDIYNMDNKFYVHPLKVDERYSPTMFFPHLHHDDLFIPITSSNEAAYFVNYIQKRYSESTRRQLDSWDHLFLNAENVLQGPSSREDKEKMIDQLCKVMIGRDERILKLAKENFSLEFLLNLKSRLIGSGYIGGKSAGLLISRMILQNDSENNWDDILEPHDSYYIGSDVFYTYIVQNGCWELFMKQKSPEHYFSAASELQGKILEGDFPEQIREQFQLLIDYFGQSPIIIRSSSLLEDAYGNAFAGKYDSFFCVNAGTPQQRYINFVTTVQKIYASTMNEDALSYRLQRGLDQMDEQMALLVMRVSGAQHKKYFFPDIGGVGLSYNAYVWQPDIKPESGMLRIVFGLGTRAVGRVEGDYPRIVAIDSPLALPIAGRDDAARFSQHDVDVLDIEENTLKTVSFAELIAEDPGINVENIAEKDFEAIQKMKEIGIEGNEPWIINFKRLLKDLPFTRDMKLIMKKLEATYNYPVDIEFTVNFALDDDKYMINLLQCRPHQIAGLAGNIEIPENIPEKKTIIKSQHNFLGGSVSLLVKQIIFIDPAEYNLLTIPEKHNIARLVGKINRKITDRKDTQTMLLGPGRWGTTTPSLGVPVRFAEINNIKILVEIAQMSENIMPELSFGSHFFLDLVETEIFYLALFPEENNVVFNVNYLNKLPNQFPVLFPEDSHYGKIIKILDLSSNPAQIMSDIISQNIICFVKK